MERGDLEYARSLEGPAGIHLGPEAAAQERRNKETDRGRELEALTNQQKERDELKAELVRTDKELAELDARQQPAEKADAAMPGDTKNESQGADQKPSTPPQSVQESRARVEQQSQALGDSITNSGAVAPTLVSLQADGLTSWQRDGMRLAIKTRDMTQAFWKVKNRFTRQFDRDRGLDL